MCHGEGRRPRRSPSCPSVLFIYLKPRPTLAGLGWILTRSFSASQEVGGRFCRLIWAEDAGLVRRSCVQPAGAAVTQPRRTPSLQLSAGQLLACYQPSALLAFQGLEKPERVSLTSSEMTFIFSIKTMDREKKVLKEDLRKVAEVCFDLFIKNCYFGWQPIYLVYSSLALSPVYELRKTINIKCAGFNLSAILEHIFVLRKSKLSLQTILILYFPYLINVLQ